MSTPTDAVLYPEVEVEPSIRVHWRERDFLNWEFTCYGRVTVDVSDLHRELVCMALGMAAEDEALVDMVIDDSVLTFRMDRHGMLVIELSYK